MLTMSEELQKREITANANKKPGPGEVILLFYAVPEDTGDREA